MQRKPNFDVNVDGQRDRRMDGQTDENLDSISHPASSAIKTSNFGFQLDMKQTSLCHRCRLETSDFRFKKKSDCSV